MKRRHLTRPTRLEDEADSFSYPRGTMPFRAPVRVTLIDLDGLDDDLLPPYTNWAEFCDVTDPDC
jgi:hypothetical protein